MNGGYLDEAARLANLVDNGSMTQAEAEAAFCAYIKENGIGFTEFGAVSLFRDPHDRLTDNMDYENPDGGHQ